MNRKAKVCFWPCWSLYSLYKLQFHKQYFPWALSPLLRPSLCLCGGWSLRKWPAGTPMKKHITAYVHIKYRISNGEKKRYFPLFVLYLQNLTWSNVLVPVWESKASAPGPGWGNSHQASSQQENTSHFPDLQPPYPEPPSRYLGLRASDALPRGWGQRGSLQIPSSLLVYPVEPAKRRRVQSSGADSAQLLPAHLFKKQIWQSFTQHNMSFKCLWKKTLTYVDMFYPV